MATAIEYIENIIGKANDIRRKLKDGGLNDRVMNAVTKGLRNVDDQMGDLAEMIEDATS